MSLEFDLIEQFFNRDIANKDVLLGIGDDGAVVSVPPGQQLVVTTDTLVGGTHFPETARAVDIGHKSLAVNLSDLAAMAATPKWFTLSLCMPEADKTWLTSFTEGLFALADKYQTALIGGDTCKGPLSITIQALGIISEGQAVTRACAEIGDDIYVTGTLGDAALGLLSVQGKLELAADSTLVCEARLHRPMPRVEAGLALRDHAHAMIDCSDGFAADLGHLLISSGRGADVRLQQMPLSAAVESWMTANHCWEIPLAGGDDYELIFASCPEKRSRIAALSAELNCPFTRVGEVTDSGETMFHLPDGKILNLQSRGYTHF